MSIEAMKKNYSHIFVALIATLILILLLLTQIWFKNKTLNLGYELSELTAERERLLEENRKLRIELHVISHQDRLDSLARQNLAMSPLRPDQIVFKNPNNKSYNKRSPITEAPKILNNHPELLIPEQTKTQTEEIAENNELIDFNDAQTEITPKIHKRNDGLDDIIRLDP